MATASDDVTQAAGGNCVAFNDNASAIPACSGHDRTSSGEGCSSTSLQNLGSLCSSAHASPKHVLERCILAYAKGFVIGAGLKGGLALFSAIVKAAKKPPPAKNLLPRSKEGLRSLKETLRYGLFLGSYSGCFCVVDEAIAAIGGNRATAKWRALVAGALAGPALLLTGQDTHHTSMAIYILLRAAVLVARCGIKSRRFHRLFRPLSWQHGDVFLMCISCVQILAAFILNPGTLPPTYISFLKKHLGKDELVVRGIVQLACKQPLKLLSAVEAMYACKGVDVQLDPYMKIPCQMIHPHQNCGSHFVKYMTQAYLRAIPVYLPVYVVPALLVHRLDILKRPLPILLKTAIALARSSLFLASFCGTFWLVTCTLHQSSGMCSPATVALGLLPMGMAVLLEKKSRRMELALYCLSRAVESLSLCIAGQQHESSRTATMPPVFSAASFARADLILFSTATAIIMHCYAQEREVFRSKYLNILDWVFGIPGRPWGYKLDSPPPTPPPTATRPSSSSTPPSLTTAMSPEQASPPPSPSPPPLMPEFSLWPRPLETDLDSATDDDGESEESRQPGTESKRTIPTVASPRASSSTRRTGGGNFPWKPETSEILPVVALSTATSAVTRTIKAEGGGGEGGLSPDSFSFIAGNPGLLPPPLVMGPGVEEP